MDSQHYWETHTSSRKKFCIYAVWMADFEEEELDEFIALFFYLGVLAIQILPASWSTLYLWTR